jgi:hypothetical protein
MAFAGGQAFGSKLVPKTISAVAPTVKYGANLAKDVAGVVGSPVQSARTAFDAFGRGYKNPANVGGEGSALMPIREKFYPHEQVAEFQAGQRTPLQMSEVSTAPLTQNTVMNRFATNMAPTNKAGESLVAPKGRGLEGYFENLGSTYKQNPYLGVLDAVTGLGGAVLTGGYPTPITALSKSIPALAARQLQKATQFEPNFSADAIKLAQAKSVLQPSQPLALPAPGPVAPTINMPGPQRNVNIEGQSFQLPNQINTANSQAARPQMQGPTPQQMAIQKTQEIVAQRQQPQKAAGPVAPTQLPPAVQPQPKPPAPQTAPATATNPKPTTEVKNYGSVGLREIKEIEARAKETGEPIKYTYFRKGEGNTTVTLNKEIKFKPDPDLKLTSAKELNNGNKEFYGVQTSTGSPVTVKFTKGKDIAVYDTNGKAIIKYDMTGKVIKD